MRCSAWSQSCTNGFPVAPSLCAISFSWCGKTLSTAPVWMSSVSPRYFIDIAEHSRCQPGPPLAELRLPERRLGLPFLRHLPDGEVADVLLLVLVVGDARAPLHRARGRPGRASRTRGTRRSGTRSSRRSRRCARAPPASSRSRPSRGRGRSRAGRRRPGTTFSVFRSSKNVAMCRSGELPEREPLGHRAADRLVVDVRQVHHLRHARTRGSGRRGTSRPPRRTSGGSRCGPGCRRSGRRCRGRPARGRVARNRPGNGPRVSKRRKLTVRDSRRGASAPQSP